MRDARLRKLFPNRPANAALFETTPIPRLLGRPRSGSSARPGRPRPEAPNPHDERFKERRQTSNRDDPVRGRGARRLRGRRPLVHLRRSRRGSSGGPPRIDILCGTSVGAINACYLAAHLADPVLGLRRLVDLWSDARAHAGAGVRRPAGAHAAPRAPRRRRRVRAVRRSSHGGARSARDKLARSGAMPARGMLRALTVSCTEVSTGRTVVFMQTSPDLTVPTAVPPRTLFRADCIGPHHALASAAIPLLFPPVRIDGELHLDGGLRQNTPIAPALRLGATHIFAIGSSREVSGRVVREAGHSDARARAGRRVLARKGAQRVPSGSRRRRHRAPHADQQRPRRRHARVRADRSRR